MSRPAKGPRLYLHPTERTWLIRDGSVTRRTGCGELDRDGAEKRLAAYLAEKFQPVARESDLSRIPVTEVLTAYGREHAPDTKSPATIGYCIAALAPWWADKALADVREATCKGYTRYRQMANIKTGTVRRELGVLQAAINHWHGNHGPLTAVPVVTLAEKGGSRQRWLTRQEASLLLAGALGFYREMWSDIRTRKISYRWRRYPGGINRHLARFIVIGLYSGTRRGAIFALQWLPNTGGGWIDLDAGVLHRRGEIDVETNKRRPPAKLGRKALAHLRRWKRIDDELRDEAARQRPAEEQGQPLLAYLHVVSWRGRRVASVRTAWDAAVELAWLGPDVTPHVLRHTRATWLMQNRVDLWEASGHLGMSVKTLTDVYGHHHPDWQREAAEV